MFRPSAKLLSSTRPFPLSPGAGCLAVQSFREASKDSESVLGPWGLGAQILLCRYCWGKFFLTGLDPLGPVHFNPSSYEGLGGAPSVSTGLNGLRGRFFRQCNGVYRHTAYTSTLQGSPVVRMYLPHLLLPLLLLLPPPPLPCCLSARLRLGLMFQKIGNFSRADRVGDRSRGREGFRVAISLTHVPCKDARHRRRKQISASGLDQVGC